MLPLQLKLKLVHVLQLLQLLSMLLLLFLLLLLLKVSNDGGSVGGGCLLNGLG